MRHSAEWRASVTKHGDHKTKTYVCWFHMIARCLNPKDNRFPLYGGRGIKVCKRWRSYINFKQDMGTAPKNKSLDRINNNGNYTPKNCRWATQQEQMNNRRNNRITTYKGRQMTLAEACRAAGISYECGTARLNRKGTIEI